MHGAATLSGEDILIGRREHQRHRLDLCARLIGGGANVRVQLEDISAQGACIRLLRPVVMDTARLCWLNFAVFGRIAWRDEMRCGLQFDEALSEECLSQTIEFGELITTDRTDRFLRLASAWVHGPGDW